MWYKLSQIKILFLVRGAPGSGKSTLSKNLGINGAVYSTDDFFMENGKYNFNPKKLSENHQKNLNRTILAMQQGISPIVADNTFMSAWELKPYVLAAKKHGYQIEFREPQTEWAWNADELAKRNTHGVPKDKIEQMISRFDPNTDIEYIENSKAPWEK
jgi:predicted kinase